MNDVHIVVTASNFKSQLIRKLWCIVNLFIEIHNNRWKKRRENNYDALVLQKKKKWDTKSRFKNESPAKIDRN